MQNRLVLTGIPSSIPRLPNAHDSLKDFVEDHACWVDRFAFLSATTTTEEEEDDDASRFVEVVAAIELHIENVRDKAIKSLDGLIISMNREGDVILDDDANYHNHDEITEEEEEANNNNNNQQQRNYNNNKKFQSKELIQKCPLHGDDVAGEKQMEKQTLHLPLIISSSSSSLDDPIGGGSSSIELTVQRSEEHGGTGTYPWRGGLILSRQICHWAETASAAASAAVVFSRSCATAHEQTTRIMDDDCNNNSIIDFKSLFCNKAVLELGAGAAGLPSMTLGKISKQQLLGYENMVMDLVASDGIDEIVNALKVNIKDNGLDDCVHVKHIDWNDYTTTNNNNTTAKNNTITKEVYYDTILFADCIYNEECALALSQTISQLLKPEGIDIGVLPDFRVGLELFQTKMREDNNLISMDIPIIIDNVEKQQKNGGDGGGSFACAGGGGKDYRLVLWKNAL